MSIRNHLIAAKEMVNTPEKWRQDGRFGFHTNRMCAMGACASVETDNANMASLMYSALRDAIPHGWGRDVPGFNDHPSTTHADIMALFDRAIASAEAPK